jgi:negative regulator of flagellin synthesis FlgM
MAIDLNGINLGGAAASPARKATGAQSTATSTDSAQPQQTGSEVSITSTASLLARLQQALAAQPAVDSHRVDSISKAISDGKYTVHADRIAHGLIQTERALKGLTGS